MSPRITVVIPVRDDARLLERCLASLATQDRTADEVIVVDNGSSDDSVTVARRFAATVIHEERRGVTAASARGFDAASGDIIARCDADSVLPATWLARIETVLERDPDAVAVTGPATFYDLPRMRNRLARGIYLYGYFLAMRLMLGHNVLFGSNCAVRASVWREVSAGVPRDDSEIHDDMDLSYRLPATSRVVLDKALEVEISPRPFESLAALVRRMTRAGHTFSLHLPGELPHRRWMRRRTVIRRRSRTAAAVPHFALRRPA